MRCKKVEQIMPDYLSGELSPKKYAVVVKHLAGCPACRTAQAKLKQADVQLQAMFAETFKGIQVPNNLQNNIKDKISIQRVNPGLPKRKLWFLSPGVAAGILFFFLVLGAGWYGLGKYDGFWSNQFFGKNQHLAGNYGQEKTLSPQEIDNNGEQKSFQPKATRDKAYREQSNLQAKNQDMAKAPALKETGEEKAKQQKNDVLSGQKSIEAPPLKESKYDNMAVSAGDKQGTLTEAEKAVGFHAWQPAYLPDGTVTEDKVYWNNETSLLTRNYRVKVSRPEEYLSFQIGQRRDNPANFQEELRLNQEQSGFRVVEINGHRGWLREVHPAQSDKTSRDLAQYWWYQDNYTFTVSGDLPLKEELFKTAISLLPPKEK
ncbi:MAG: hypothetical protein STSR0004_18400 [Peptococcaceae bacterium]